MERDEDASLMLMLTNFTSTEDLEIQQSEGLSVELALEDGSSRVVELQRGQDIVPPRAASIPAYDSFWHWIDDSGRLYLAKRAVGDDRDAWHMDYVEAMRRGAF